MMHLQRSAESALSRRKARNNRSLFPVALCLLA